MSQSREYWLKRSEQRLVSAEQKALRLEMQMKEIFDHAYQDIEMQIYRLYTKYAKDNQLNYQETMKYLNNKELKFFKEDVDSYIEMARDKRYRTEYRAYLQALSTRARVRRLEEYKAHLKAIVESAYSELIIPQAEGLMAEVMDDSYLRTIFDACQGAGLQLAFNMIPKNTLSTLLEYPWSGSNFSKKWNDHINNFELVLEETLTKGLITGASNQKMARELAIRTDRSYKNAIRLVRTETNFIHNEATAKAYESLGVDKYEYLATLDGRTSPMCQIMDGKKIKLEDKRIGENYPPLHPWCRSTTIPVVYEDDEPFTRIARDESGKNIKVPSNMKYAQWKAIYSK